MEPLGMLETTVVETVVETVSGRGSLGIVWWVFVGVDISKSGFG